MQCVSVEVAAVAYEVCFDAYGSACYVDCGAVSDIHYCPVSVSVDFRIGRIDSVGRQKFLPAEQIGCGKSDGASELSSADYFSADGIGSSEPYGRIVYISCGYVCANHR